MGLEAQGVSGKDCISQSGRRDNNQKVFLARTKNGQRTLELETTLYTTPLADKRVGK